MTEIKAQQFKDLYVAIPNGMTPKHARKPPKTDPQEWGVLVDGLTDALEFNNPHFDLYLIAELSSPTTMCTSHPWRLEDAEGKNLNEKKEEWYHFEKPLAKTATMINGELIEDAVDAAPEHS